MMAFILLSFAQQLINRHRPNSEALAFGPALASVPSHARHGSRAARGDQVRRDGTWM